MSEGNGFANREAFFARTARRYVEVECDGLKVRLQSLTELEKSNYENYAISKKGGLAKDRLVDARLRLIVLCMVDAEGKRLFGDVDLPKLRELDCGVAAKIYDAARVHIGSEEGEIEGLIKNSERVRVDDSQ